MSDEHETRSAPRIGWWVFIGLAVLTLIEYLIAVVVQLNLFFLVQLGVLKAGLIVVYFMRIGRAFQRTEEEED